MIPRTNDVIKKAPNNCFPTLCKCVYVWLAVLEKQLDASSQCYDISTNRNGLAGQDKGGVGGKMRNN